MATYDFQALYVYDGSTGAEILVPGSETESGTLDDGEGGNTFETSPVADSFTGTFDNFLVPGTTFDVTGTFAGTLNFVGLTVPVGFLPQSAFPAAFQAQFPNGAYVVADPRVIGDIIPPGPPTSITIGDLDTSDFTVCFFPETAISNPTGTVAVEDLSIGDEIVTADGSTVPVKWIGKQTVLTAFVPADRLRPVRVTVGALGDGLPLRDLLLTQDHALLIDGLLVNAGALVNGTTIRHEPLQQFDGSYTVYHIETEAHDVILAEGTPAETYIDYTARRSFDNYAEYLELYGEDRSIAEMAMPRITSARLLPQSLRERLGRPSRAA